MDPVLNDGNRLSAYEKRQALDIMLKMSPLEISTDLIFPLLDDEDERVQNLAAQVLAKARHPALFSFLVHRLESSEKSERVLYIQCLRQLRNPAATLPLLDFLADRNPQVRLATALAFASFGEEAIRLAVGRWIKLGREDRVAVIRTFGQFVVGGNELFAQAIQDEDWWVRCETIKVLGKSSSPFATPLLLAALNDEFHWVRLEVVRALKGRKDEKIRSAVKSLVNDMNMDVSAAAYGLMRAL